FQVGGRGDDDGVIASQLQKRTAKARGDPGADGFAHPRRARGADERDAGVVYQLAPLLQRAQDHLAEAFWSLGEVFADLIEQGLAGEGGEGCFLAWLPKAGISADQGQG